jgi:hypothetical protein
MAVQEITVQLIKSDRLGYPTGWRAETVHSGMFGPGQNQTFTSMPKDSPVSALISLYSQVQATYEYNKLHIKVNPACLERLSDLEREEVESWINSRNNG